MALGYRYVPDSPEKKGAIEIVAEEADLVRRIFHMYLQGIGMFQIARKLSEERVPTKADRSGLPNKKQRPRGIWATSSIARILKNESYYRGVLPWNHYMLIKPDDAKRRKPKNLKNPKTTRRLGDQSEWLSILIPKIIDEQTSLAAQAQISKNRSTNKRQKKNEYMFLGGRLKCIVDEL
jgi:hypothetical protein